MIEARFLFPMVIITDITEIEYPLICYAFFASERP